MEYLLAELCEVVLEHTGCELQHFPPPLGIQRHELLDQRLSMMSIDADSASCSKVLLQRQMAESVLACADLREEPNDFETGVSKKSLRISVRNATSCFHRICIH